ncbi:MAG: hydroxymethylglutaryl-CoA reductase [Actinomycetales bacterium]
MTEDSGPARSAVPRDRHDDTGDAIVAARRDFVRRRTGIELTHVSNGSIDPATTAGNVENFIGVAQVPIGLAGPLLVDGEHARGEFYVPLATTEGALVASYNRGMRLLHACGGARTTVVDDHMQRSPAFECADARAARDLRAWVEAHRSQIAEAAQATSRVATLEGITSFIVGPLLYLRMDYATGDAAGQNMVSKATLAACEWICQHHPDHPAYLLSGNIDTDKKHSQVNMLLTRGKRVVAEAWLTAEALQEVMGVTPEDLFRARQVSQAGAFMVGSANNGAHAANGLTALFIATGQDVANVVESHAAIVYNQLLPDSRYYWSITLPSLIVATHGGGTRLATQSECLAMLGCTGTGSASRLAEIAAATVLAGEISLASAVLRGDWVAGHERLGRNR